MKIVIDTNILMSALIKDSVTRKIIIDSELDFCYPKISLNELRKHEKLILNKSKLKKAEYEELLKNLLDKIIVIPDEFFFDKIEKASKIMKHIDPDDVVFLALAFSYDIPVWSDDNDFKKQKEIEVFTTSEFMKKFLKN
jgi:predicted nucleic acid-binding protein